LAYRMLFFRDHEIAASAMAWRIHRHTRALTLSPAAIGLLYVIELHNDESEKGR